MQDFDAELKREAIRSLINIAVLEGIVLMGVVGVYLYTGKMTYLVGGVVASTLIFGPAFIRWFKAHGKHLKTSTGVHDNQDLK